MPDQDVAFGDAKLGDIDNDGDLDIFSQLGGAYLVDKAFSALYENPGNANAWIGIELHSPARPYCEALKQEGILCKETHDHVIRIAPPLVIKREEIDWAFERIKKVVEK